MTKDTTNYPEEAQIRDRLHTWRRTGTYYRGQNWSGERAMAYDIDRLLGLLARAKDRAAPRAAPGYARGRRPFARRPDGGAYRATGGPAVTSHSRNIRDRLHGRVRRAPGIPAHPPHDVVRLPGDPLSLRALPHLAHRSPAPTARLRPTRLLRVVCHC